MGKRDPSKIIGSLDEIARRMDALRSGALTTSEALAKAAKDAKELKEMFPLDVDALFKDGMSPVEQLDALKEFQKTSFGGARPSDIQGTAAQNIPAQTLADIAAERERLGIFEGSPAPGMSIDTEGHGITVDRSAREGKAWGEMMTPSDTLRQRGIQGQTQVNLSEANAFADQLEATVKRFEAGFPNAYFTAVVLAMEIPYLRIGARSVAEAKLYIQSFEPVFGPGFARALSEPGLSQLERSLTGEAIRILQTGTVGGGSGGLSVPAGIGAPPPAEVPPARQGSTSPPRTAGIGGGAGGALGASSGAATGATAGISAQIAAVGTQITALNRRLDPAHFFQPLVDGQFRPMRREIQEVHQQSAQLGARIQGQIASGLERYALSGALTTGTTQ